MDTNRSPDSNTLIARLEEWLRSNRPAYFERLLPGAADEELSALEARYGLQFPNDFRAFYRWRNGQHADDTASLQNNLMFSSLEEIVASKRVLDDMIGHDFDDPSWWRKEWVPFLANGGGDHLCLDLTADAGKARGQIISFWHDAPDRPIQHPSFAAWLADFVESAENGTLRLS